LGLLIVEGSYRRANCRGRAVRRGRAERERRWELLTSHASAGHPRFQPSPPWRAGPAWRSPLRYGERVDHYRLLRTVQAMYGLPPLGHSADAPPITDVWRW